MTLWHAHDTSRCQCGSSHASSLHSSRRIFERNETAGAFPSSGRNANAKRPHSSGLKLNGERQFCNFIPESAALSGWEWRCEFGRSICSSHLGISLRVLLEPDLGRHGRVRVLADKTPREHGWFCPRSATRPAFNGIWQGQSPQSDCRHRARRAAITAGLCFGC